MPVQFRCSLCRKKLKVSRRKSGTQVACPNCGGSTPVPTAFDMDAEINQLLATASGTTTTQAQPKYKIKKVVKPQPKLEELPLFEREDFAELLDNDDDLELESTTVTPADATPAQRVVEADAVVMSRASLTMYVIAVVSLLGLAFAAGFLVGSK